MDNNTYNAARAYCCTNHYKNVKMILVIASTFYFRQLCYKPYIGSQSKSSAL